MTGLRSSKKLKDGLPGPDIVSCELHRMATSRPHHLVEEFYKGHRAGYSKAVLSHGAYGGGREVGGPGEFRRWMATKVIANCIAEQLFYDAEGLRGLLGRVERTIEDSMRLRIEA